MFQRRTVPSKALVKIVFSSNFSMFLIHPSAHISTYTADILYAASSRTPVALVDAHGLVALAQIPQLQRAVVTRGQEVKVVQEARDIDRVLVRLDGERVLVVARVPEAKAVLTDYEQRVT